MKTAVLLQNLLKQNGCLICRSALAQLSRVIWREMTAEHDLRICKSLRQSICILHAHTLYLMCMCPVYAVYLACSRWLSDETYSHTHGNMQRCQRQPDLVASRKLIPRSREAQHVVSC